MSAVSRALEVWDNSTVKEQREIATGLFEALTAYAQTKDTAHLVQFAESVDLTMRLRQNPKYVKAVRASANRRPPRAEETVDVREMLREFGLRD